MGCVLDRIIQEYIMIDAAHMIKTEGGGQQMIDFCEKQHMFAKMNFIMTEKKINQ